MASIADQIKSYWMVISTVIGATVVLMSIQTATLIRLSVLETVQAENTQAIASFVNVGPRYTLKDHYAYADQQAGRDAAQDQRLTILEQEVKRP